MHLVKLATVTTRLVVVLYYEWRSRIDRDEVESKRAGSDCTLNDRLEGQG
jgi:hypothetical protein